MQAAYMKQANISAGIWLASVAVLVASMLSIDGNIWDHGNIPVITIMLVSAGAYCVAFWAYTKAKGHSGLLGVALAFLSVIGLAIVISLKDKHTDAAE